MKYFRQILFFLFIFQYTYAQPLVKKNDLNITNKLLLQSAHYLDENNLSMARKTSREVMKILFDNNKIYEVRTIEAYNRIAFSYYLENNLKFAKEVLDKTLYIQDEIKRPNNPITLTYYMIATINKAEKKYTVAINYYKKTLQLIKTQRLNNVKFYLQIQKNSKDSIKELTPLAKKEIVYKDFSFLDFVHNIKTNSSNITIREYLDNKSKNSECVQILCEKMTREYLKSQNIYTEYLNNPSQNKKNLFNFYKITNFNYLLNTLGACMLSNKDMKKNLRDQILNKLYHDLLSIIKHSKNPLELDLIAINYKDFNIVLNKLNISSKFFNSNEYFSKTSFFDKLQFYKDIQLKAQNPRLVSSIPDSKKKLLFKRYEYFTEYFDKYYLTMLDIIKSNDSNRWNKFINNLLTNVKNKKYIIDKEGERGKAKVWAIGVMLYFKNTFNNYQAFFKK